MPRLKRATDERDGIPRLELLKLLDNTQYPVQFLASAKWLPTHYNPRGSIYCYGPGKCLSGAHRTRVVWKGYAPVHVWAPSRKKWISYVFEITEELGRRFGKRPLRGTIWEIWRDGKKAEQAPIIGRLLEERPEELIPDPFSILGVLFDLYRVEEPELLDFPPLPERLYLPDADGPGPKGLSQPLSRRSS